MLWWTLFAACQRDPGPAVDGPDGADTTDTNDIADTTGGGGGGGDDTPAPDTDIPPCTTTCWSWITAAPSPRPSPPAGLTEYYTPGCNVAGLDDGVCPSSFTCEGRRVVVANEAYTIAMDPCVGDLGPHTLVVDVPLVGEGPPEPTIPVHLHFTLSGEIWPGGGEAGQAGMLVLTRSSDGLSVDAPMPVTRNGRVDLDLPEGTWAVRFRADPAVPLDDTRWPHIFSTGALQVVAEEEVVDVDVVAVPVTTPMRVDGAVVQQVPAGVEQLTLSYWSPQHGAYTRELAAGASLADPILLEPDAWDVGVMIQSDGSVWPNGGADFLSQPVVAGAPAVIPLSMQTAEVRGEVVVDRARPGAGDGLTVWWGADAFEVGVPSDGRYVGRVWAGRTYTVSLEANRNDLPSNDYIAQTAAVPGVVDVRVSSATMAGVVTLRGATPARGVRGAVELRSASGELRYLPLPTSGDASFSALVWQEPYDVWVSGNGDQLPGIPVLVLPAQTPRTGLAVNVSELNLTLSFTVNGAAPSETAGLRGSFLLSPVDPVTHLPSTDPALVGSLAYASVDGTGPATGTVTLVRGSYSLAFQPSDLELPAGGPELGVIDLTTDLRRSYDLQTVTWNLELQHQGGALPVPATGDRGLIFFGSSLVPLPTRGPARVRVITWPGVVTPSWSCPTESCGLTPTSPFLTLYSGLLTEP